MAIIRQKLPENGFTKYDNKVFLIDGLSDGAKVLYGYMASMKTGKNWSDTFFMKGLKISEKTLYRRKKELSDCGLIYVDRIGLKSYILYIGYSDMSARQVKANWKKTEEEERDVIDYRELISRTERELVESPEDAEAFEEEEKVEVTPVDTTNIFD